MQEAGFQRLQSYPTQEAKELWYLYVDSCLVSYSRVIHILLHMWEKKVSTEKHLRQFEPGQEHWSGQGDGKTGRAWLGSAACLLRQPLCKGQMFDLQNRGWGSEMSTHHPCKLSAEQAAHGKHPNKVDCHYLFFNTHWICFWKTQDIYTS